MEKRVHKRVFRRLDVKFTSGDISRNAITSNISDNGELTLPSGEVIQLRGRVARAIITPLHNKDGMGVELTEIPPEYTEFIKTLL
jgi:hypothetical protein